MCLLVCIDTVDLINKGTCQGKMQKLVTTVNIFINLFTEQVIHVGGSTV